MAKSLITKVVMSATMTPGGNEIGSLCWNYRDALRR